MCFTVLFTYRILVTMLQSLYFTFYFLIFKKLPIYKGNFSKKSNLNCHPVAPHKFENKNPRACTIYKHLKLHQNYSLKDYGQIYPAFAVTKE